MWTSTTVSDPSRLGSVLQRRSANGYDVSTNLAVTLRKGDFRAEEWITVRDLLAANLDGARDSILPGFDVVIRFVFSGVGEVPVHDLDGVGRHYRRVSGVETLLQ